MSPAPVAVEKSIKSVVAVMPNVLALLSGFVLAFCYPGLNRPLLVWVTLVPFFFAATTAKSGPKAMFYGFLMGVSFFLASIYWMIHVHPLALILLVLLQALFYTLLGWLLYEGRKVDNSLFHIFWVACCWTTIEVFRSEIAIFGFGWNLLAYSQAYSPIVSQSANTVGAFGLGFVIALFNAVINEWWYCRDKNRRFYYPYLLVLPVILIAVIAHGKHHLAKPFESTRSVRVSVVQGNIPQEIKWLPSARQKIIEIYSKLTELASFERPELIVWPEASFPGYFNVDQETPNIYKLVEKIKSPVLIGSPYLEPDNTAYNSAYYLGENGKYIDRYDKLYLVPFGEYMPFGPLLSWLRPVANSLGISDFVGGSEFKTFSLKNGVKFSSLICFEDTFANLARKFHKNGPDFFVVMTNDAWFGKTRAAEQHFQASIFRAIELGVPVVRAANTGISGFISPRGKILDTVKDDAGKDTFVTGFKTLDVDLSDSQTLYAKGGWLFSRGIVGLFLFMSVFLVARRILT